MIVFSQIIVLFLMILTGYVIKKKNIITDAGVFEMSRLLLYVTLPALVIKAMQFDSTVEHMKSGMKMSLISLVLYAFSIAASYLVIKMIGAKGKSADVLQLCMIFPNVSFMGYPVVMSVYGEEGVFYAAFFNMFFDLLIWTVGIFILNRSSEQSGEKKNLLLTFLNPGTVAVLIGLLFFLGPVKMPKFLDDTLMYLSRATIPIAMIVIGSLLSKSRFIDILKNKRLILVAIIKTVVFPVTMLFLMKAVGMTGYYLSIPVLIMSMPSAANIAIFAEKQNSDGVLASQGIFLSTILSLATIPLMVNLIQR